MTKYATVYCSAVTEKHGEILLGAWAFRVEQDNEKTSSSGNAKNTNQYQMELYSVIFALDVLTGYQSVINVFTNSHYVEVGVKQWYDQWLRRNDFRGSKGLLVYREEWTRLFYLISQFKKVNFFQMKNEDCDAIAKNAILELKRIEENLYKTEKQNG